MSLNFEMESGFLPPGFRFHPTDTELLQYYLKRKVTGLPFHVEAIPELDLYKFCPWDLPVKSQIQGKNHEWYFFCPKNRKHFFGFRVNRANEVGYWKISGRDRPIYHNSQILGMKKILVFYLGRAPLGERTNWVMYEYRLHEGDRSMELMQDTYVLCRVFKKSAVGRRSGEEHGLILEGGEEMNRIDELGETGLESIPPVFQQNHHQLMIDGFENMPSLTKCSIQMGGKSNQSSTPESVFSSTVASDYNFPTAKLHFDHNNSIEIQNTSDRYAVEAVLKSNDFGFCEDLESFMIQSELNMDGENGQVLDYSTPTCTLDQMWLSENKSFVDSNNMGTYNQLCGGSISNESIQSNNLTGYDGGLNFVDASPVGLKTDGLIAEEESYWLDDLFNVFPEDYETLGIECNAPDSKQEFGKSIVQESRNDGHRPASVLQSFWDSIPARSASAVEFPPQHNASSSKTLLNESRRMKPSSQRLRQRRRKGGSSSQIGFVCGLAFIGLAMWVLFLVVVAKIGFFFWDLILN